MDVKYKVNRPITTAQFVALLVASTLGERRPIDDLECMAGMVENADLSVTAWAGELLVGISRAVTDFHYACYVSDLAVHGDYQRMGIGKKLLAVTQEQLGARCKLILLAAPAADAYYAHIGFTHHSRCWVLAREDRIDG